VKVHQAYRFALDPGPAQERALRSHAGAARFAWNWGLAKCVERYDAEGRWYSAVELGCGAVKTKLALSERTYACTACGLVMDRDVNAARNLLKLAASGAESQNACGGTVRPGLAGHVLVKQEPGTAPAGKTGTASRQPLAARQEPTQAH
jgi:transposase